MSYIDISGTLVTPSTENMAYEQTNHKIDALADTIDHQINSNISTVNARIDNIIAHNNDTEGNTELIDIRAGADGHDLRNNSQSLTLAHRLQYYHESTNEHLETLSNKVLLSGDMKVGSVNIVDCSTIVGDAAYPYDNVSYYAVDANTLIKIA